MFTHVCSSFGVRFVGRLDRKIGTGIIFDVYCAQHTGALCFSAESFCCFVGFPPYQELGSSLYGEA